MEQQLVYGINDQIRLFSKYNFMYMCDLVPWDSEFFKKKIAFIQLFDATSKQIKEKVDYFFQLGMDCIYIYSSKPIDFNGYDVILADRKRTYIMHHPKYNNTYKTNDIKYKIYSGEPASLYDLAFQSGEFSRFKIDPHFSEDDFLRLYKTWVDNSITGGFADYVLVVDESMPKGFITAREKDGKMIIGLFATDVKYRGKGIGRYLMQHIINIAAEKDLKVEVVTQAENKVACRVYEKMGFEISDEIYVYHVWNAIK